MLQQLRGLGMKIRRQDFQASRRQVLGLERHQEGVQATPGGQRVPKAFVNSNPGWKMSEKFLYRFEVVGSHPDTGVGLLQFFSISSNTELTVDAATAIMVSMLVGQGEFYRLVIDNASLRQVVQR